VSLPPRSVPPIQGLTNGVAESIGVVGRSDHDLRDASSEHHLISSSIRRQSQLGEQLMTLGAVKLYRALLHPEIPSYYNEHDCIGVSRRPVSKMARGFAE
jgi:hypothetical protein